MFKKFTDIIASREQEIAEAKLLVTRNAKPTPKLYRAISTLLTKIEKDGKFLLLQNELKAHGYDLRIAKADAR